MKRTKRLFSILLAGAMVLALAACSRRSALSSQSRTEPQLPFLSLMEYAKLTTD